MEKQGDDKEDEQGKEEKRKRKRKRKKYGQNAISSSYISGTIGKRPQFLA